MIKATIPVLRVTSSIRAEAYYTQALGFAKGFAYRPDESREDPCYLGFHRDGVWLHVSSFSGDGVPGCVVYIKVDHVDELYREFVRNQATVEMEPTDQTWGNREVYLRDPDGNSLRFVQEGS